jgi:Ca2+-binding RTX toxin-like protein
MNKKLYNCNSKRKSIADHVVVFKNKKVDLPLISLLFLFWMCGTLFLLVEFDTKYHHNIINIAWADAINGTENADNITGTINKDIIKGLNGNDTISGMESGDDISGGSGDDIIYGNEGRDVLKGKAGNDRIEGGEGNDRLIGDRGNDILIGGSGNDTLTGGLGKDIFICGIGTDTITDFNITQKDSAPENDCENIKYDGNAESTNSLPLQQQQQQSDFKSGNINSEEIIGNTNTTTKEETNPDGVSDFFFGLFK